jgi:formylglycine-generating enzyme required for sulfatase activity
MTNISWHDALAYTRWLSQSTGAVYRLPSEAEWEYAARAGTTTEYPFNEGDKILLSDARFNADSPLPVNTRSVNANQFRLRHMLGNVREWVADAWYPNYRGAPVDGSARMRPDRGKRVVRGGAFTDDASRLRSAARMGLPADTRDRLTGFRVVREIRN